MCIQWTRGAYSVVITSCIVVVIAVSAMSGLE